MYEKWQRNAAALENIVNLNRRSITYAKHLVCTLSQLKNEYFLCEINLLIDQHFIAGKVISLKFLLVSLFVQNHYSKHYMMLKIKYSIYFVSLFF